MTRPYDIALFGATGFTGRQAAHYLASHAERDQFSFVIAARSGEKLEALDRGLREKCGHGADGLMVADALDAQAMSELAKSARIVATTAGPFAKYGNELVHACVSEGTHYVDITGETPWIRGLIDRYHEQALASGTRIIPCCGFDSVPSDLGTLIVADRLHRETGNSCGRVEAFHRARGGLNGGTVASLINMQKTGGMSRLSDPFLLNPAGERPSPESRHRDPVAPFYSQVARSWAAPFLMALINTRVVRRSHALLRLQPDQRDLFSPDFVYQEYWKAPGWLGLAESSSLAMVQAMTQASSRSAFLRGMIEKLAAEPGTGPSEATMDGGFFSCDFYATSEQVPRVKLAARFEGKGDPGNRITVKCFCESALLLALEPKSLPTSPAGGVLTPASGLGLALAPRLEGAGIHFSFL